MSQLLADVLYLYPVHICGGRFPRSLASDVDRRLLETSDMYTITIGQNEFHRESYSRLNRLTGYADHGDDGLEPNLLAMRTWW